MEEGNERNKEEYNVSKSMVISTQIDTELYMCKRAQ